MADATVQGHEPTSAEVEPGAKRRKVRKGTQSCWECKRRKTRCAFSTPMDAACEGCRRRATVCISQEFPDEPAQVGNGHMGDRLSRVEALVEQLANKVEHVSNALLDIRPVSTTRSPNLANHSPSPGQYDGLYRALVVAWPSQRDLDLILRVPAPSAFAGDDAPSSQELLRLPPPPSHPVLVARKLLVLATFLQDLPPRSIQMLARLSASRLDIMAYAVEKAVDLVTSKDDLVASVEGIECIMLESRYYNYEGNFRRSWLATRRAMALAQMMGLHQSTNSLFLKIHEPKTRARVNSEEIWFRLVQSDRYLSWILGLPQGSLEENFASPETLADCTPLECMQRLECVASGRILQRNVAELHDLAATHEIDKLLQKASGFMPPQWWIAPHFESHTSNDAETFGKIIRIMSQFTHYHLLSLLHLPYLVQFSAYSKYDYSRMTAINASREVLARFVYFHSSHITDSYCRGVDFLAFIASAALCLAHIDAHQQHRKSPDPSNAHCNTVSDLLTQQRLKDRGMIERALKSMEDIARTSMGTIFSRAVQVIQHLLVMESNAASGSRYCTKVSTEDRGTELECGGKVSMGGHVLQIHVPYFGTITVEREVVLESASILPNEHEQGLLATSETGTFDFNATTSCDIPQFVDRLSEQAKQPPFIAEWSTGSPFGDTMRDLFCHVAPTQESESASAANDYIQPSLISNRSHYAEFLVAELPTGADDWDPHNTDIASI